MKKSLNKLSSTLKSSGHIEASTSVDDLINVLDDVYNNCHTKTAQPYDLLGGFMPTESTRGSSGSVLEKWQKIIIDYNKVPYNVENLQEVTNSIKDIIKPFIEKKKNFESKASQITNEDKEITRSLLSPQIESRAIKLSELIKEANGSTRLSLFNNIEMYIDQCNHITEQYMGSYLEKLALEAEAQDFWSRLLHGDKAKAAARVAGKVPGFWERTLPWFGLLFSLPLTLKNIREAYINGKKIAEELPLSKYNIDKSAALTGNPALLNSLVRDIEEAINDNKDNPDNLYEILEIAKTIAAYWLDLIFSITNALMLIIDVLSIMAVIIDGPLPIGDVASGIFGALASFGLIGVEFAAEHYVDEYWKRQTEKIKYIAEKNIKKLGGEIPEETSESSDSSQLSRGENAPTNRTYDLLG